MEKVKRTKKKTKPMNCFRKRAGDRAERIHVERRIEKGERKENLVRGNRESREERKPYKGLEKGELKEDGREETEQKRELH